METSYVFKLFLTVILSLNLLSIFMIGKQKSATTPAQAFSSIIFASFLIYGIWNWI